MDNDSSSDVFANRDAPIPIVVTSPQDEHPESQMWKDKPRKRSRSPVERLREKIEDLSDSTTEGGSTRKSIQDRMFNKLFEQFIPTDPGEDDQPPVKDRRSRKYVDRPNFSLPVMSNNFRRFNARIGVVFVFQNRMIRLLSWVDPSHTLSFLSVYTLVCLNPNLLAVLPLAATLFFIMVPSFITRHPAPPTGDFTELYPFLGPPTAPARHVKPAPDFSKDFFRNMRDLQNSMEDFSRLHDKAIALIAPLTNFSNEPISSSVFLIIFTTACGLFVVAALIPWRITFLLLGWAATAAGHPSVQKVILSRRVEKLAETGEEKLRSWFIGFSAADNIISSDPETREVEVFELQRRSMYDENSDYEPYIFGPSPYTPLSPSRTAGDKPKGTRFFEDVKPPSGWRWADKKWTLDLLSTEWVGERIITGVEVEIEGERWVSDILYDEGADRDTDSLEMRSTGKKKKGKQPVRRAWEEGNGTEKKGEWRRRRWVRVVRRIVYSAENDR